ncbi:MAG: ATP-binding protein [Bacteroidales bacterium]|jgi:predicted AAA+ superfamily ATPase|nr:ATP-binding protein [Bacteroidales bacterium]
MVTREIFGIIKERFFKQKALILVGPRQTGKTTLLRQIINDYKQLGTLFLNCDEPETLQLLENASSTELKNLIGSNKIILIDEAQRVENIGITLKLIVDNIPDIQLVVTGSSAFDLRNRLNEPLTGRKFEYRLFPFSTAELINATSVLEEKRLLEKRLIFGMYPDVVNNPSNATEILIELVNSYLFKDILMYKDIRYPNALTKLLMALALQLGSEVSYNELGNTIGMKSETVERYIELLEKVFVIFRLRSFNRNIRNELKKSQKVYFYDNGVRNALIQNFKSLNLRTDSGALWENFMVSERRKYTEYNQIFSNKYFWRTHAQQEIDYIEERDGMLYAFEFKWNERKKVKLPTTFATAYPQHEFECITPANYLNFITLQD